jgi:ABC-type multidrug transport system fused ATPase/permease subunit
MSVEEAVSGGVKELGLRFNLIGLLPTAALVLFVVALIGTGGASGAPDLSKLPAELSATRIIQLLLLVLIVSLVAHPLQLSLVRILEGYAWETSTLGDALSAIGVELHRRRLEQLQNLAYRTARTPEARRQRQGALERARAYYPEHPNHLLPTRLGNALRAAEDRAGQRYGLDTNAMMPRLYPFLSTTLTEALTGQRNQLDVAVRLCTVLVLGTGISAVLLLGDDWWMTVPLATGLLAWIAYRAAVQAAVSYGRLLYVAFDLHRFDMLRGLHYRLPDRDSELTFNQALSRFLRGDIRNLPAEFPYEHPDEFLVCFRSDTTCSAPPSARPFVSANSK